VSLKVCQHCATGYAGTLDLCPHCGGGVFSFNWEETMPKITAEGGASHYHDDNPAPADGDVKAKPKAKKAADVDVVDLSADARESVREAISNTTE